MGKKNLIAGSVLLTLFALWTVLVQTVDVQPLGPMGSEIGFAALNGWFHQRTGIHMTLYSITDWMGLIPLLVCVLFGGIGLVQWIQRKKLQKVDADLLILGVYYIVVVFCYVVFEILPVNYRPILINGVPEASYPSSTTLLVLGVMPTLAEQAHRRVRNSAARQGIRIFTAAFSTFVVLGRLICGVHWITDIVGSVLLSAGLFSLYRAAVMWMQRT